MAYVNAKDLYNWYVEDVIRRNDTALAFKAQCAQTVDNMPIESVRKFVEDFYKLKRTEQGEPNKKTEDNDFVAFQKNLRVNIIIDNFANRPETLAVKAQMVAARKSGDEETLNGIIDSLYAHFNQEIAEKKLEEKIWRKKLVYKATEVSTQKIVNEDFNAELDSHKDHGNCTKAITLSLLQAAEKYGVSLFPADFDAENLAHPKDIAKNMEKYLKSSESGFLRDISNIQKGDIVLLSDSEGTPRHAMMVSGFNEQGTPLLLGFTATQKNVPMFESKTSEPRKGVIIDVYSFITDKVNEHNCQELTQMMFTHKNGMNK